MPKKKPEPEKCLEQPEHALVELLKEHELSITTAESCTGGLVAAGLVSVAGVSEVFSTGLITYSNKAKRKYLDVKKSTLKKHTAVSAAVAKEMAVGGALAGNSDICISVTGLAGPDGGSEEIPVGTVFIGCCLDGKTWVKECHFEGEREAVRRQAAETALVFAADCIREKYL